MHNAAPDCNKMNAQKMGFWLKSILTEGDKQKKLNQGLLHF